MIIEGKIHIDNKITANYIIDLSKRSKSQITRADITFYNKEHMTVYCRPVFVIPSGKMIMFEIPAGLMIMSCLMRIAYENKESSENVIWLEVDYEAPTIDVEDEENENV